MAIVVNTNTAATTTQRLLYTTNHGVGVNFEQLASGFRINRAADDAAGLQIVTPMTSQIQGMQQAARNATDAVSVAQVVEGAMAEIAVALQRMRVLSIQNDNGINSALDKQALQQEFSELLSEIDRIAAQTEFNGKKIMDGSSGSLDFLVGANQGQTISLDLSFDVTTTGLALNALDLTSMGSDVVLPALDQALAIVNEQRADLGAKQNRLLSTIRDLSLFSENLSESRSRIRDTDFAAATTELTRVQIIQQSSLAVLAQANQKPQAALAVLSS